MPTTRVVAAFREAHRGPCGDVRTFRERRRAGGECRVGSGCRAVPLPRRFVREPAGGAARAFECAGGSGGGGSVSGSRRSACATRCASFSPGKMRGERLEHNGVVIWNDCYNSNPEAARAMLDVLRETPARRRIAVLGEMLELGQSTEPLHREIGRYVAEQGIDVLIGVRGAARFMVERPCGRDCRKAPRIFLRIPRKRASFCAAFCARATRCCSRARAA